jgi:hypothetical protein
VRRRVADVDRHGVAPVRLEQRPEPLADERERLLPARRRKLAVRAAQQRRAEPVRVLVQILQRDALGAQEAVREHVLGVAAHLQDLVAAHRHREAAGRLAERARSERGPLLHARGG